MNSVGLITEKICRPVHNRGHDYSNSFTLVRGVQIYPQDTTPQHVIMCLNTTTVPRKGIVTRPLCITRSTEWSPAKSPVDVAEPLAKFPWLPIRTY